MKRATPIPACIHVPGLTLRDYFAAQMIGPIVASGNAADCKVKYAEVAQAAYHLADAMMAERKARPE